MSIDGRITSFYDGRVDIAKSKKSGNDLKNARRSFTPIPEAKYQLPKARRHGSVENAGQPMPVQEVSRLSAEVLQGSKRKREKSSDESPDQKFPKTKHPSDISQARSLGVKAEEAQELLPGQTTSDAMILQPNSPRRIESRPDLDQAKRIAWIMHNGLQEFKEQHPRPTHKNVQQYNFLAEIHNKHVAKYADQFPGQLPKRLDLIPLRELPQGVRPDLIAPLLKLKGGMRYRYNEHSQEYYGRIITLRDPKGRVHVFNSGESNRDIARFTSRCIDDYRTQHADQWIQHLRGQGYHPSDQQFDYYKNQYNEGKALTTKQVMRLQEGNSAHSWECTQLTDLILQKSFYYTDQGTEITALNLSDYQPYTREEHDKSFPPDRYPTIAGPTPIFNCHGHFINRAAWLVTGKPGESGESQIRKILEDNGYKRVAPENAQINDIVAYYEQDGSISHTAIVVRVDGKIIVESKMGPFGLIHHDMDDSVEDGQSIIFHTERQGGHLLRTTRPMNPLS